MITPLPQLMYNTLTFIYYNSVFIAVLMIKTQIKATEKVVYEFIIPLEMKK